MFWLEIFSLFFENGIWKGEWIGLFGKIFPIFVKDMEAKQKKTGKKFRPDISEEKMGVNPFVGNLKIKVRSVSNGYTPLPPKFGIDASGRRYMLPVEMVDNMVDLDVDIYFKVFDKAEQRIAVAGLSFRALQLWIWSLYTVESGKDYLWMNVERAMEECGIKCIKTYRTAITELCVSGYISPCVSYKNVYWINPAVAFKGNRAKKFPENVVRKQTGE